MTAAPMQPPTPPPPSGGFVSGTQGAVTLGWLTAPGVLCRQFDDSPVGVVYDGAHARTHLLDGLACQVLLGCGQMPMTLAQLQAINVAPADTGADDSVLATVRALEVAGLLVRRPLACPPTEPGAECPDP
jgi:hypothetical protein